MPRGATIIRGTRHLNADVVNPRKIKKGSNRMENDRYESLKLIFVGIYTGFQIDIFMSIPVMDIREERY